MSLLNIIGFIIVLLIMTVVRETLSKWNYNKNDASVLVDGLILVGCILVCSLTVILTFP